MNETYGVSIEKIIKKARFEENLSFNKFADKVLECKDKVHRLPDASPLVYRKQWLAPGPRRAQSVFFRLAPLLQVEDSGATNHISDGNASTVTEGRLPCFPERTSSRQTETPSSGSFVTSGSTTPVAVFKRRVPTETFLSRRPTIEKPIPIRFGKADFVGFRKSIELKALPFKKTSDSYKFYNNHFPLLLTKITQDTERCSTGIRTPVSPMSAMINWKRAMNQRIVEQEFMMDAMEKETDDCEFVTELHSDVFDPAKWPWNKLDVQTLKRRYTIDASLADS